MTQEDQRREAEEKDRALRREISRQQAKHMQSKQSSVSASAMAERKEQREKDGALRREMLSQQAREANRLAQAKYRATRFKAGPGGDGQHRLATYLDHDPWRALSALTRHYGIKKRDVLNRVLMEAAEAATRNMTDEDALMFWSAGEDIDTFITGVKPRGEA